jgi:hypothetical protein
LIYSIYLAAKLRLYRKIKNIKRNEEKEISL